MGKCRLMNKTGLEIVEEFIWEEIARDLAREKEVERCLCLPDRFRAKLLSAGVGFPLEEFPGSAADLFLGWQILAEESAILTPEEIFSSLKPGGEARIFGFYSSPRPEEVREWAGRVKGKEPPGLPPPGAVSLGAVAGWLKTGPFGRYTIRKRGIYYDCRLGKEI